MYALPWGLITGEQKVASSGLAGNELDLLRQSLNMLFALALLAGCIGFFVFTGNGVRFLQLTDMRSKTVVLEEAFGSTYQCRKGLPRFVAVMPESSKKTYSYACSAKSVAASMKASAMVNEAHERFEAVTIDFCKNAHFLRRHWDDMMKEWLDVDGGREDVYTCVDKRAPLSSSSRTAAALVPSPHG